MLDIHLDILQVIFFQDTKDIKDLMFFILRDMILLGYLPSNMQLRQVSIQKKQPKKILTCIEDS